jgi:NAD(P)-dependent dehydrogenase (short-subunit alcohol dehydrogenase family)
LKVVRNAGTLDKMNNDENLIQPVGVNAFSLAGETALITGGGTGLGQAIASAMVASGAKVAITGRRGDVLQAAAAKIGSGCFAFRHDLTARGSCPGLVAQIEEKLGAVTILVNNAGVHLKKPFAETSEADFRGVIETHVHGAFAMTQAVLPGMQRLKHGSIIFIASMTSVMGMPSVIAYSAAKTAYLGMVRSLASELAAGGIRVNAIAPGWIETPMLHKALDGDPHRKSKILSRTPMGRFGRPEDIGHAAVYLCSRAGEFVNGVLLPIDGGASIGF